MSLSPNEKYPGATADDPNYKAGKFKDNNPSTTNNGSPLKAIDRNERLALEEAIMTDAGFNYNGTPDTPQDSQMFRAYKASLSSGKNLLPNPNFIIPSPDESLPAPDGTARSYPPGHEIFSNVFANETSGITNLTYIDGRLSFSGGDFYMAVPNTASIENITEFVASVADFDGKPRTRGVSYALVGDEYRVTVGVDALTDDESALTPLGSVKFERGDITTAHEIETYSLGTIVTASNGKQYYCASNGLNDWREYPYEKITNANGVAYKYWDGRLVCKFADSSDRSYTADQGQFYAIIFPYEFASTSELVVSASLKKGLIFGGRCSFTAEEYQTDRFSFRYSATQDAVIQVAYIAEGTWV